MTADTHEDLRALAEKATGGQWLVNGKQSVRGSGGEYVAKANWRNGTENAAFIAAANPSRVIALLDEIERLRTALKPFGESDMIGRFDLGHAGEDTCVAGVSDYTYGDLNAARAALTGGPDHD